MARQLPLAQQIARSTELRAIPRRQRTPAEQAELDNLDDRAYQRARRLPSRADRIRAELAAIEAQLPAPPLPWHRLAPLREGKAI